MLALGAGTAQAAFPGDDGRIVFASNRAAPDGSTDFEIYSMDATGGDVVQLTDNVPMVGEDGVTLTDIQDLDPVVSPDGTRIAFSSNRPAADGSTDPELYVMHIDGTGLQQVTDQPSGPPSTTADMEPAWSPDGKRLAFRRGSGQFADLFVIDLATGAETRLVVPGSGMTAFDGLPAWSPDGSRIAFRKGSGSAADIWIWDVAAASAAPLTAVPDVTETQPSWSPDGSRIAFARGDEGVGSGIWTIPAGGGEAEALTQPTTYSDTNPAWSPSGDRIVFQTSRHGTPPVTEGVVAEAGPGGEEPADVGNLELYSIAVDGTDEVRLTEDASETGPKDQMADWQPLPSSDLSLALAGPSSAVTAGTGVALTATVRNDGPTPATAVTVSFTLPAGATPASAAAAGGSCTIEPAVACTVDAIPANGSAVATVVVAFDAPGSYTADAVVKAEQPDPDSTDDAATTTIEVVASSGTTGVAGTPGGAAGTPGSSAQVLPPLRLEDCTIVGTAGADVLRGTSGADRICALGGDDVVYGLGGDDVIEAGAGDDIVQGGAGADVITGSAGRDTLIGGVGADRIFGGTGADLIQGRQDRDRLYGNAGDDTLLGGGGSDRIFGGTGRDVLRARDDTADRLDGGADWDRAWFDGRGIDSVRRVEDRYAG